MTPLENLNSADKRVICEVLQLPLPDEAHPFEMIIAQEKIHPADILVRLERSTNLRAMIAAAALRGTIKQCPPAKGLKPKPYPKAPVRHPKTAAESNRVAVAPAPARTAANPTRTLASFVPNPKRPGSVARTRYNFYKIGCTEAELLARGLLRADFRHDTQHGHITWNE